MKERGNATLKRLDRWIGIPLVFLLGATARWRAITGFTARRRRSIAARIAVPSSAPVRFTLLKSAAIGDTVLLSAAAADLKQLYPGSHVCLACGSSNAEVARWVPSVDEIVVLPMGRLDRICLLLPKLKADVFIDFDSWPRINALIACLSGSGITVGFETRGQHRHHVYDDSVRHDWELHEVENYRNLVRRVASWAGGQVSGRPAVSLRLPLPVSRQTRGADAPYVVLHMHSGGSQARWKEWPPDHWRAVASHLLALGYTVYVSGSADERDRNRSFVGSVNDERLSLSPSRSLGELIDLLRGAKLLISVDTGIAHLAGAASVPTLVLHGPTSPARWGALGPSVHHVKDDQSPWINLGFETFVDARCIAIGVGDVVAAADHLLGLQSEPVRCGQTARG